MLGPINEQILPACWVLVLITPWTLPCARAGWSGGTHVGYTADTQTGPSYLEGSVHGVSAGRPVTKTTEASLHTHCTKLSLSDVLSTTLDRRLLPRRPDGRPEPLRVPPGPVLTRLAGVGTVGWGANTHRTCFSLGLKGAAPSSLGRGESFHPGNSFRNRP